MNKKIGFIGLGKMGANIAKRFICSGYPVTAFDICSQRMAEIQAAGATPSSSSKELAMETNILITMLPQLDDTERLLLDHDGLLNYLRKDTIYIDMSTSSLELTLKIYKAAGNRKIKMLDAPVSGGASGAENGTLTIMVGGCKEVFEECKDLFEVISTNILYTGKAGNGVKMKLLNNLVYSINICALAEIMALGESIGMKPEQMLSAFKCSSAGSYCVDKKAPAYILQENFSPGFSTDNLLKDIKLAMDLTEKKSYKPVFSKLAQSYFQTAQDWGLGGEDNSSIIKVFRSIVSSGA